MGSYRRKGASEKTPAANPPGGLRWGYASITKTLVGVVMQLLMANSSLPEIRWRLGQMYLRNSPPNSRLRCSQLPCISSKALRDSQ